MKLKRKKKGMKKKLIWIIIKSAIITINYYSFYLNSIIKNLEGSILLLLEYEKMIIL